MNTKTALRIIGVVLIVLGAVQLLFSTMIVYAVVTCSSAGCPQMNYTQQYLWAYSGTAFIIFGSALIVATFFISDGVSSKDTRKNRREMPLAKI
ncbi:MAG TPA: hypothetical protein VFF30_06070 [Nitrososphaerales archaeon]|nr:hypothetical protein [Nitrososphaerales archaeon]